MASPGEILLYETPDAIGLRLHGQVTLELAAALWHTAVDALASGKKVHVDLSACTYLDSTLMGTLLRLRRTSAMGDVSFYGIQGKCRALLEQLGLYDLLGASASAAPDRLWTLPPRTLPQCPTDQMCGQIVWAHRELANVAGPCGRQFGPIARLLTAETDPLTSEPT
ncbi:MAG: hypothetical protein C4297_03570 [Gemmataceae bacterium]